MSFNLSTGILKEIFAGSQPANPIVQILGCRKIVSSVPGKDKYRLCLSDGMYSVSVAMLGNQALDKFGSEGVVDHTVIMMKKYITSIVNNDSSSKDSRRVLLIVDVEIMASGHIVKGQIGNPVAITDDDTKGTSDSSKNAANSTLSTSSLGSAKPAGGNAKLNTSYSAGENFDDRPIHPISSLNPFQNRWIIKARVSNKSAIRTWSNARGEGKLFSFELVDESGEIRCTAFKEQVDKFFDMIEIDKVYFITKCQLKTANKQFNNLKNDYEMTLTSETVIQECCDQNIPIPQTKFDFTSIEKIAHMEPGTLVDCIAVCKAVSDVLQFQARTTKRDLKKREVTLIDQSNMLISLTLWNEEAENFNGANNPVIALKGVKIGEFGGGKSLSTVSGSLMKINPDIPESHKIRAWYDQGGANIEGVNVSGRSGSGNLSAPFMCLKEVRDQGLGSGEKGDYFNVSSTILLMKSENFLYKACPSAECNKKVIDLENGMYRCEKCNQEYGNYKHRLMANMNIADWSNSMWVTMFQNEAEKIIGMTADEIGQIIENDPQEAPSIAEKVNFKEFNLTCRAKMETYNDEARLKSVVVRVEPIDYAQENQRLIDSIKELSA